MPQVTWELEDVYPNDHGSLDAIIVVDLDYDEPDKSVGYTGGWTLNGWELQSVKRFDDEGEPNGEFTAKEFQTTYAGFLMHFNTLVERNVQADSHRIFEQAAEDAQGEYEAAQEAKAEAKREDLLTG